MGKREIGYKASMSSEQAFDYLTKLLDGLKSGTCYVQNDDQQVSLRPSDQIEFEIEATEKKDKEAITIEMSWSKPHEFGTVPELKISANEPVAEAEAVEE